MAKKVKGVKVEAVGQSAESIGAPQPLCSKLGEKPLVSSPPAVIELQFTHTVALNGKHTYKIACFDWNITEYPDHYKVQCKGLATPAPWYNIPKSICIAYMMGE